MSSRQKVYLDYSATTPTDARVVDAMLPYFTDVYGNASSSHGFGRNAQQAIDDARETVARILNCSPTEIIFTSGGTESDNLAVRGTAWTAYRSGKGNHLITTPVEHSAVGNTVRQLTDIMGFESTILPVDKYAMIDIEELAEAITDKTTIASLIYANNEVGSITPLPKISEIAHEHGVMVHSDAVQAAGQLTLDVQELGVDLLSISAHKFYGPKGVGVLYIRDGIELIPSQTGGSHEEGRRPGTHNTPGIIGLAKALEIAYDELNEHIPRYRMLRDKLIDGVLSDVSDSYLTGHPENRLDSHASFIFPGVDSAKLLMHLDMKGIAASGGSACKTGNPEPSNVLLAMGYDEREAIGSLRLTVGRYTTEKEIDYAIPIIKESVEKIRKLSAMFT